MNVSFSPRQQRVIGHAVTGVAVLVLFALTLMGFRVLVRFLGAFSGVFMPLAVAGVLGLLLHPLHQSLRVRLRLPAWGATSLLFLLLALPLLLLLRLFGLLFLEQLNQMLQSLPGLWEALRGFLSAHAPALERLLDAVGGADAVKSLVGRNSAWLVDAATGGVLGLLTSFGSLLNWVVLPVYLVFFLAAPPFRMEQVGQFLPFLSEEARKDVLFLLRQFVDIVVVFFRGQLSIAFAQGLLMALGFSLCGLQYGFLLGLLFGFLNLVPYLGNLAGLSVTLPIAALQPGGGAGLVVAVLGVLALTQAVESYVLTPRILGDKTGLHPMAVIFAMFFWGKAIGGVLGLLLAIPLTAFLVVFWRLACEKYLPRNPA